MRIENTDRFRNKYCQVTFKNGTAEMGTMKYIPAMTEKYNYHKSGWFLVQRFEDSTEELELSFKEIKEIIVLW